MIVETLLAQCVDERHRLREAITQRMNALKNEQELDTQDLQESIEGDAKAMQGAWEEQKRLEKEQKGSFAKAQALISSQVFHEVRNALSSVVAMSEMTSSLQKDPTVTSQILVDSVSEMLGQNKEVVNYSLNMLNNILDVSKIKAGSFETHKKFFDLQELIVEATNMEHIKAEKRGLKMSYIPLPEPHIVYSDEDIVSRIITNFIGNAIKCTSVGAVQPFVCSIEDIELNSSQKKQEEATIRIPLGRPKDDTTTTRMKMIAVGVAHTGSGLNRELLDVAKTGLFSSVLNEVNSSAKNSGFSLHLANQLAGTLDTEVYLTDLNRFQDLFNQDMLDALRGTGWGDKVVDVNNNDFEREGGVVAPSHGSVLYITLPAVRDVQSGVEVLNKLVKRKHNYSFRPRPVNTDDSSSSNNDDKTFNILVADDVPMLRKGLLRSVIDVFSEFSDCPVLISTACTAEDALRALKSQPYDLFICDNQYARPDQLLPKIDYTDDDTPRPRVIHNTGGNKSTARDAVTDFFTNNEKFTIEEDDGILSGLDVLYQLVDAEKQGKPEGPFPTPVLMLLTGHRITLPEDSGIIVVQKPLKRAEFVPLLEEHAYNLIKVGLCTEEKKNNNNEATVFNKRGTQIFTRIVES